MPETTLLLGPWAPDHPAYGGNKIASGGSVILEDAKGVYPTLGGYRALVSPGTSIGAFTNADFAELLTPNTLASAAVADIWLDFDDTSTMTTDQPGIFEFITQINNKITGASNHATSLYQIGSGGMEYVSIVKLPVGIGQTPIPSVDFVGSLPGSVYNGSGILIAGNTQGGAMDISLSAQHTGTTLWFCTFVNENFYTDNSNNPDTVLLEFGNDGEVAENNADSAVLRRDGTNLKYALVRSGDTTEEAVQSSTYSANANVIVSGYFDGTNKKLRVNGTEVASELSSGAFDITRIRIGGRGDLADGAGVSVYSACWRGQIHVLVVGTGTPSDSLMEQVEGYIAHAKAVTSLLPSGHTYKSEAPQSAASTNGANEPTSHFMCWSRAGAPYFFVGDYSKLWLLNQSGMSFDDVSNASTDYLASRDLPWQFAQFGNRVIAVSKNTTPQYYDLGVSSLFADLPGTPPKARAIAQVRDFIFMGSLIESDGTQYEYRVRWSGFNDSEDWTTDPGGTQADFQDLDAQYGEVMAIVGGEYATVFQQRAITRFTYVGPPAVWQRDTLEINRGTIAPLSVIQIGRITYYYSHDGFWAFDGASSQRISGDQIHRWVENRLSEDTAQQMRVDHDPDRRIIVWAWPYDPSGASRATSGLQLIFNYESGQWSYNFDTQKRWWIVRGPPTQDYIDSSEELIDDSSAVIDTEETSFARTMALNYDGELWRVSTLDGGDTVSRLETAKLALTPGYRTFVTEGRVIGNIDSDATVTIAVNSNPAYPSNTLAQDAGATEVTHNSVNDGFFAVRSEGRYHSFMVQFDGGKGETSGDLEELVMVQGLTLEYRQRGKH